MRGTESFLKVSQHSNIWMDPLSKWLERSKKNTKVASCECNNEEKLIGTRTHWAFGSEHWNGGSNCCKIEKIPVLLLAATESDGRGCGDLSTTDTAKNQSNSQNGNRNA
jgi:hypothetical protein